MSIVPPPPDTWSEFSHYVYRDLVTHQARHPLVVIGQQFDWRAPIAACAGYHHRAGPGRPAVYTVAQLFKVYLAGWVCGWSPAELEFEARNNLLVRWFGDFDLLAETPDYQTLKRFGAWLRRHAPRAMFDAALTQIDQLLGRPTCQTQAGDTFAVRAKAAREDEANLMRHLCRKLLNALSRTRPELVAACAERLTAADLFGDPPVAERRRWTKADRLAQRERVAHAAAACAVWVTDQLAFGNEAARAPLQVWLAALAKVLADGYELSLETAGQVTSGSVGPAPGEYRLGSATDVEATYRTHGAAADATTFGYNVQVAIDLPDTAAATPQINVIREICAATGATPDVAGVAALLSAQAEQAHPLPTHLIYDAAAGTGKAAHDVAQTSAGHTHLVTHPIDHRIHPDRFSPERFELSTDGQQLTCPNGATTSIAYRSRSGHGRDFRFLASHCCDCPLWRQCRPASQVVNGRSRRLVYISDYRAELRALYAAVLTVEFAALYKRRSAVERVIAILIRYHGARNATGIGLAHVDFQMKMAATAYNLRTWVRAFNSSKPT